MATTNSKSKTYLKNVGKSFGYAAMDVFEHYNPTLTNLYKSSKEAVTEAKRLSKEAKLALQQAEIDSDKGGMSYILEDLASGKWYNKERQTEDERYLSTIAKEEDWGDDTTAEAVADTARDIMKQNDMSTRKISDSLSGTAQSISTSIGYASAQSADYIVKSFGVQTRALYGLTANGFDRVTNVLLSINSSIDGIASMGEGLNTHMKNSAIFYINATQSLSRIDTNIEKLVKMQEAASKPARGISRKNTKGIELPVYTNSATSGVISQEDYFDREIVTKENLVNYGIIEPNDFVYNPRVSVTAPVGPISRNKLSRGIMSPLYLIFGLYF